MLALSESRLLSSIPKNVIALDPNVDDSTTFLSKRIAALGEDNKPIDVATSMSKDHPWESMSDWIDVHRYLVSIFSKFGQTRVPFLQYFAAQIVERFSHDSTEYFSGLVTRAAKNTDHLLVVFSDNSNNKETFA